MMQTFKERLPGDIYAYLVEHGPCTAYQIALGLNPAYKGRLNAIIVAQNARGLRGQGKVEFHEKESGHPAVYEAVME